MIISNPRQQGSTAPEGGLPTQWTQREILTSLLRAVRGTLTRNLGIDVKIIHSNSQAAKWSANAELGYPRAYVRFGTWETLRELNNFTIARRGWVRRIPEGDNTQIYNARVFPIMLSGELHILTEGSASAINHIGEIGMLNSSRSLGLQVKLANGAFDYMSIIQIDTATSLDDADFSSENRKAAYDTTFPFQVRGWLGRIDRTVMNLKSRVRVYGTTACDMQSSLDEMLKNPEQFGIGVRDAEPYGGS